MLRAEDAEDFGPLFFIPYFKFSLFFSTCSKPLILFPLVGDGCISDLERSLSIECTLLVRFSEARLFKICSWFRVLTTFQTSTGSAYTVFSSEFVGIEVAGREDCLLLSSSFMQ